MYNTMINRTRALKDILWFFVLFGLVAGIFRFWFGLGATTNLTDSIPWGLWKVFNMIAGVALSTCGFTLGFFVYVLKMEKFKPLLISGRMDLIHGDGEILPFRSNCFSKACTVNTIFYSSDVSSIVSELWRILREEGVLTICFTHSDCFKNRSFVNDDFKLFSQEEVIDLMQSKGFRSILSVSGSDKYRQFMCITGRKK